MAYYKKINGKQYDRELLEIAEKSVSGKGDGRISTEDAKQLLEAVKDADSYTDVEKATMEYIRDNFKFTAAADKWFRKEIRSWAAKRGSKKSQKKESVKKGAAKSEAPKKVKSAVKKKEAKKKPSPPATSSSKKKDSELKKEEPTPTEKNLDVIPLLPLEQPKISEEKKEHDLTYPKIPALDVKHEDKEKNRFLLILGIILLIIIVILFLLFRFACSGKKDDLPTKKETIENNIPAKKDSIKNDIPTKNQSSDKPFKGMSKEEIEKLRYSFQIGTTSLTDLTKSSLDTLSETLKSDENLKLKIIGHACDIGSEKKNMRYSINRAKEVQMYLLDKGISKDRLIVEGKGETDPEFEGESEEIRTKNRRVQFKVIE